MSPQCLPLDQGASPFGHDLYVSNSIIYFSFYFLNLLQQHIRYYKNYVSDWSYLYAIKTEIDDVDFAGSDNNWGIELYANTNFTNRLCKTNLLE